MQHVQVLPLVFVQPLYLDVEEGVRINGNPCSFLDERGKIDLVGSLYLPPLLLEYRILGPLLQPRQLLFHVAHPGFPSLPEIKAASRGLLRTIQRRGVTPL